MTELADTSLLTSTVRAAVQAAADRPEATFDADLWSMLEDIGLPRLGLIAELGGEGGSLAQVVATIESASRFPVAVPLADVALVAGQTYSALGQTMPSGVVVVAAGALEVTRDDAMGLLVSGVATEVPSARVADTIALVSAAADGTTLLVTVQRDRATIIDGTNLADEPRDEVRVSDAPALRLTAGSDVAAEVMMWGGLARATQLCGALASVLELSVTYAMTRQQFSQPLSGFQAIQHHLAAMAGELVSAKAAVDTAVELIAADRANLELAVSLAKSRTGEAAGESARLAHQIHGALGFTRDHDLQRFTRRLWSWRDEYGTERVWQFRLGQLVQGELLWQTMTSVP
jgi:acyl-CoA dehydrogenase